MITARLFEGISIKTCKQCKADNVIYETSSVDEMLSHLNTHNLAEIEFLKTQKTVYRRVLKE